MPTDDFILHRIQFIQVPLPLQNPRVKSVSCRQDTNLSVLCDPQQIIIMEFLLDAPVFGVQHVLWNYAFRGGVWEIFKTHYNPLANSTLLKGGVSSTMGAHPVGSLTASNLVFRYSDAINKERLQPKLQSIHELWFRCKRGVNGKFPQRFIFQSWGCQWSETYK